MSAPKILAMSGSLRKESFNTKLLREAVRLFGDCAVEWADLRLPLYDGDVEERGIPEEVLALARQISEAEGVILASPEYNSSPSGVLKNALDWVSRVKENPWAGKPVSIISATAGRAGGARAQYALRLMLAPFRLSLVAGPEVLVASAYEQFDENGRLKSEQYADSLSKLMAVLRAAIG